jgi:hypothetical protein
MSLSNKAFSQWKWFSEANGFRALHVLLVLAGMESFTKWRRGYGWWENSAYRPKQGRRLLLCVWQRLEDKRIVAIGCSDNNMLQALGLVHSWRDVVDDVINVFIKPQINPYYGCWKAWNDWLHKRRALVAMIDTCVSRSEATMNEVACNIAYQWNDDCSFRYGAGEYPPESAATIWQYQENKLVKLAKCHLKSRKCFHIRNKIERHEQYNLGNLWILLWMLESNAWRPKVFSAADIIWYEGDDINDTNQCGYR